MCLIPLDWKLVPQRWNYLSILFTDKVPGLITLPGYTARTKTPEIKLLIYKMQTTKTSKYFQEGILARGKSQNLLFRVL